MDFSKCPTKKNAPAAKWMHSNHPSSINPGPQPRVTHTYFFKTGTLTSKREQLDRDQQGHSRKCFETNMMSPVTAGGLFWWNLQFNDQRKCHKTFQHVPFFKKDSTHVTKWSDCFKLVEWPLLTNGTSSQHFCAESYMKLWTSKWLSLLWSIWVNLRWISERIAAA